MLPVPQRLLADANQFRRFAWGQQTLLHAALSWFLVFGYTPQDLGAGHGILDILVALSATRLAARGLDRRFGARRRNPGREQWLALRNMPDGILSAAYTDPAIEEFDY